jgi:NADPH:quinone reductase-like Zn-dependent oxidoreductase
MPCVGMAHPPTWGLTEVDTPVPAADEVLVRVRATSVNPYDWHNMRDEPCVARLMSGTMGVSGKSARLW